MAIELILGLGNPGERYARTRHNIGFEVADELRRRRGRGGWLVRPDCELAVITRRSLVVLARPTRYMNRSGEVAERLLADLEIEPSRMVVVVDDVDLPLGDLRLRERGGPGTHNGLRDLCARIGRQFPRLRIGVRGPTLERSRDLADYVLAPFEPDERPLVRAAIERAADALDDVLEEGFARAMNRFNRHA